MKQFHLLFFASLFILTSCVGSNVLMYKNRIHYSESSIITSDSTFTLVQRVTYNVPWIIDEEHWYHLELTFPDTAAAKTKGTLDLTADTNIIKVEYGEFSIWDWDDEDTEVSGQIEIIHWDMNKVILKEKLIAIDHVKDISKKFKGTRTFKRKEGW